jgi:hypothetical protein
MQVLRRFVATIPDEQLCTQRCDAELLPALHDLAAILFGTELRRAELLRNVWQVLPECRPLVWRVARQLLESACTALQPTRLRLQNLNLDPNDTVDTRDAREVGDRRRLPFGMGYQLRPRLAEPSEPYFRLPGSCQWHSGSRLAITEGSAQPPDGSDEWLLPEWIAWSWQHPPVNGDRYVIWNGYKWVLSMPDVPEVPEELAQHAPRA